MRYTLYKVPRQKKGSQGGLPEGYCEILVGSRPEDFDLMSVKKDWNLTNSEVFISVTDTPVSFPLGTPYHWLPWVEDLPPNKETIYAALRLINFYVSRGTQRLYIHCDAGTHRSPTIFGAYLLSYFTKRQADAIASKGVMVGKNTNSDPVEYVSTYLKRKEIDADFLKWISSSQDRLEDYPNLKELTVSESKFRLDKKDT